MRIQAGDAGKMPEWSRYYDSMDASRQGRDRKWHKRGFQGIFLAV